MNFLRRCAIVSVLAAIAAAAQVSSADEQVSADQVARFIGADRLLDECKRLNCTEADVQNVTLPMIALRQQITEVVVSASLDIDGVLAEIANEHARLMELRSVLQGRRDRAMNLVSVGNVVIGTGLGIVLNALQFSNSTAMLGDGIGVASGAASTVLSVVGIRLQGPGRAPGRIPNMLAPLLGREPALHSAYPDSVLAFLNAVPKASRLPRERGSSNCAANGSERAAWVPTALVRRRRSRA